MTKQSDERTTPQKLFDELNKEFNFQVDLAASDTNHKCERYFSKNNSSLGKLWKERGFCNPPYSDLFRWVSQAYCYTHGTTVMVLPCDTSTKWFSILWDREKHCPKPGVQLRFPEGRYKFGKNTTAPKFATIIAVIKHELAK